MRLLKMQPTVRKSLPVSSDEALTEIRRAMTSPELTGHVVSAGHCVDFSIEKDEQRFWSPHLSVQISDSDSGAELFGRFSPRPEIWTMFMAVYFVTAALVFVAGIYGYVQWVLGHPPWAFVLVPVGLGVILGLHIASLIGQEWSADQMQLLKGRLERTVELAFGPSPSGGSPESDSPDRDLPTDGADTVEAV